MGEGSRPSHIQLFTRTKQQWWSLGAGDRYVGCASTIVMSFLVIWFICWSIIIIIIRVFSHTLTLMVFHWNLSDSKSPQVFWTLPSILSVLNNAVVWMVSTRPPTSKSSSPFSNPLVTVPKAPITIGIIVTCMFHSFILLFTFFQFYSGVSWDSKVHNFAISFFFFYYN